MKPEVKFVFDFGPFRVDPKERLLLNKGVPVRLTDKVFDTLLVLLQKSGHLVEKSELIACVWQESFVEEGNLAVTISMLRKALGDHPNEGRYIETIPKRGYRFAANVRLIGLSESRIPSRLSQNVRYELGSMPNVLRKSSLIFVLLFVFIGLANPLSSLSDLRSTGAYRLRSPSDALGVDGGTHDWEAYRLYLEGRYLSSKRTEEGLRESAQRFQQAVARDPHYAQAYAGLAQSYILLGGLGIQPIREVYPNAKSGRTRSVKAR